MKTHYQNYLFTVALFLLAAIPLRAEETPLVLLENTTTSMINALSEQKAELKKDPMVINRLVERILIPHMDFISASKWVMGKHWRRADKQQKIRFIKEFRTLLISFYSAALADFLKTNEVSKDMIRFLPLRGDEKDDVTIRSEVYSPGGKIVPVNYYLHQTHKGWKVYDVSVEGISMITTYRNSFANEIKSKGVDGLINSLAEKNSSTSIN